MFSKPWVLGLALVLSSTVLFSMNTPNQEQVQIPQCLAAKITLANEVLAENKQFKIIELASKDLNALSLLAHKLQCGHFVNVSSQIKALSPAAKKQAARDILKKKPRIPNTYPASAYPIQHQEEVYAAINQVSGENIWNTLIQLTSLPNRSALHPGGVAAAHYLKTQFEAMVKEYGRKDTAAYFVKTGCYSQPSLVTVIGKDIQAPAIVLGAHMDTLEGPMPGADDDGSGSSSVMEAARLLLASKITLRRPIYIIWYAAEERGLVGSQYVVSYFMNQSIPVKAVVQFDMTGYRRNPLDPGMWLYTDNTDTALTSYLAELIQTYIQVPVHYSSCGYACSDHATWYQQGVPAALPCDADFKALDPHIHTSSDTMEHLNLDHMIHFTQLALAFAIELAM